jgi:hypothetical protein
MIESAQLRRAITPMLYRYPGNYLALRQALESMPVEALRDLHRLLQNAEDAKNQAERTAKMFGFPRRY